MKKKPYPASRELQMQVPVREYTDYDLLKAEAEKLRQENTYLRGLVANANIPCVYCGLADMSQCKHGFPGCPQGDDMMIAESEVYRNLRNAVADQIVRMITEAHLTAKPSIKTGVALAVAMIQAWKKLGNGKVPRD